jgi:Fuc2NAc and GlcNAc transferase
MIGIFRRIALKRGMLDVPSARSSHATATPRGGGVVIVLVTLAAAATGLTGRSADMAATLSWLLGGALVGTAGFLDDLHGLSAPKRLIFHVLACIPLLIITGGPTLLPWHGGFVQLGALGWLVGALAIVWSINLFNFMDGIDGLAASQAVFVAGSAAFLASGPSTTLLPLVALVGATAGFLVWNFPPAKIFMGDVGSGFIGFAIAAGALLTAHQGLLSVWTWIILHGLFIADATVTVLVRLFQGQHLSEAHSLHLYQRLARRRRSHRIVTLGALALNLLWCLPWATATIIWPTAQASIAAIALVPLFVAAVLGGAGRRAT